MPGLAEIVETTANATNATTNATTAIVVPELEWYEDKTLISFAFAWGVSQEPCVSCATPGWE